MLISANAKTDENTNSSTDNVNTNANAKANAIAVRVVSRRPARLPESPQPLAHLQIEGSVVLHAMKRVAPRVSVQSLCRKSLGYY